MFKKFSSLFILVNALIILSCEENGLKPSITEESNDLLIDSLIESGYQHFYNSNQAKSQECFAQADSLITTQTDTTLRISLIFGKTELKKQQALYENCLENYYEAVQLATLIADSSRLGLAYFNISSTYYYMGKLEFADKYNLLAQKVFENTSNESRLMNCKIIYASICSKRDNITLAKKALSSAIEFYKTNEDEKTLAICLNNYGNLLTKEKKHLEAIEYFKQAVKIDRRLNNPFGLSMRLGNIAETYIDLNELELAKCYIDSSLTAATEIDSKETILTNLHNLVRYYKAKNQPNKALEISEQLLELKTEVLQIESSNLIVSVEEKYKNELEFIEAQNKINLLEKDQLVAIKEQERAQQKFYFLIILSLIVIFASVIFYRKQKKIRSIDQELYEAEREFLVTKNQFAETEKKHLKNELEFKRKELITFSTTLEERELFLENLKATFRQISPNEIPQKPVLDELRNLLNSRNNDGSVEIYNQIEKINSSFHFRLKSHFPDLTEDDIRLASLIILGMSSKEISQVLHIEAKSVNMKRYRLKKKLNLDQDIELSDFLYGI